MRNLERNDLRQTRDSITGMTLDDTALSHLLVPDITNSISDILLRNRIE